MWVQFSPPVCSLNLPREKERCCACKSAKREQEEDGARERVRKSSKLHWSSSCEIQTVQWLLRVGSFVACLRFHLLHSAYNSWEVPVSEANVRAELFSFFFLVLNSLSEHTHTHTATRSLFTEWMVVWKNEKAKKLTDWPERGTTDGRVDENNIHSTNSTGNINTFAVLRMRGKERDQEWSRERERERERRKNGCPVWWWWRLFPPSLSLSQVISGHMKELNESH